LTLIVPASLLGGCFATTPSQPTQIQVEIDNASSSTLDGGAQSSAEALHSYLVGQLQYSDRDFDAALVSLEHVTELLGKPTPEVNARLTDILLRRGDVDRALEESTNAVIADPDDTAMALIKAGLLESRGHFEEAALEYQRVLEIPSIPPEVALEAALLLAQINIRNATPQKAVVLLEDLDRSRRAARQSDSALFYFALGQSTEQARDFVKAEAAYTKAFELDPADNALVLDALRVAIKAERNARVVALARQLQEIAGQSSRESEGEGVSGFRELADLILLKEDYSAALKHLAALEKTEIDPLNWRMKIALAYLQQQKFQNAVRQLQLSLALRPESYSARYILGSIYAGTGQPKEALAELLQIPAKDELFIRSRTFAAIIYRQEKNLPGAERVIREGLAIEPGHPLLVSYLITALKDQHKFTDAAIVLNEVLKGDPDNEKLLFSLGQVMHEQGREAEAMVLMERVVKLNPRHPEATNFVAYGLVENLPVSGPQRRANLDRALELAQTALMLKPDDGYLLDTLGWIYFKRGELPEARDTLERAVAQVANDGVIAEHYADVLVALNEYEKALVVYTAILDANSGESSSKGSLSALELSERQALRERVRSKIEEAQSLSSSSSPGFVE